MRAETTEASIGLGFLPEALPASARTRWLAMPGMRKFERPSGPSYLPAKPSGRRCERKPHHSLQCMPSANPSPCQVSCAVRARQGMRETMLTEFDTGQVSVRRFLVEYRSWICSKLGCRGWKKPFSWSSISRLCMPQPVMCLREFACAATQ